MCGCEIIPGFWLGIVCKAAMYRTLPFIAKKKKTSKNITIPKIIFFKKKVVQNMDIMKLILQGMFMRREKALTVYA